MTKSMVQKTCHPSHIRRYCLCTLKSNGQDVLGGSDSMSERSYEPRKKKPTRYRVEQKVFSGGLPLPLTVIHEYRDRRFLISQVPIVHYKSMLCPSAVYKMTAGKIFATRTQHAPAHTDCFRVSKCPFLVVHAFGKMFSSTVMRLHLVVLRSA